MISTASDTRTGVAVKLVALNGTTRFACITLFARIMPVSIRRTPVDECSIKSLDGNKALKGSVEADSLRVNSMLCQIPFFVRGTNERVVPTADCVIVFRDEVIEIVAIFRPSGSLLSANRPPRADSSPASFSRSERPEKLKVFDGIESFAHFVQASRREWHVEGFN